MSNMRVLLSVSCLSLACVPALSAQQTLGRAFVDVINSGDSVRQAAFLTQHLSVEAFAATPLAERVAYLQTVARTSGGLDIGAFTGPGSPLEVRVRTKRGGRWAQLYIFTDRGDSSRITDYGTMARRGPAADSADAWPAMRLPSETAAVREIERHADGAAARDEFSGTVLVAKGDRVIFAKAYGLADRDWQMPNTMDTKFMLASMGKMFTAVAVAQLVEAGKLRFSDTLVNVLPEYPNRDAARRITIAQLLSHSAGLGMLFDRPGFEKRRTYAWHRDLLPVFANEPLLFEPGTRSAYSNEGFVVLAAVVEKITGQTFRAYLRQHVFEPAGMLHTDAYRLDEVVPARAVGYAHLADDPLGTGERRPNWTFLACCGGEGAGGEYATAPDILRFVQALRAGRLLRRELVDTLLTPQSAGRPWYGYGFMMREYGGKAARGHSGAGPGSGISTECTWFVDGSYTVIVLSNYDPMAASDLSEGILHFLAHQ
jgi:CubicO group peptidase (beta-lactamase class C family)